MNRIFDCVIIGAGIVGANIFSLLSRCGYNVCLVDKANDVATGASKANSALIHAGYDPKQSTLKAKLNVQGNKMYEEQSKRLGLSLLKSGAFVVGNNKEDIYNLIDRGKQNGVSDLEFLDSQELHNRIPNLNPQIKYGMFSKNSYICNPYLTTICLAEEGIVNGGKILLNTSIISANENTEYYKIATNNQIIFTKKIVNCAGAGYNEVANILQTETYDIQFRRGEYYVLDNTETNLVPTTIFPLPDEKLGKGVLITPTLDGNILVGPTSEKSDLVTKTTSEALKEIKEKANLLVKNINFGKTIRVFSGIRTIVNDDFIIEKSKNNKDVINVAGICSPGLSSAPAIALMVKDLLGFENQINPSAQKITPYFKFNDLKTAQKNEFIKQNSQYGKIICKCEGISEGEIVDALHRPLSCNSIDGIKRRTRAGMGRCQGGFCMNKVAEIIARENGISLNDVLKENMHSSIMPYDIKE